MKKTLIGICLASLLVPQMVSAASGFRSTAERNGVMLESITASESNDFYDFITDQYDGVLSISPSLLAKLRLFDDDFPGFYRLPVYGLNEFSTLLDGEGEVVNIWDPIQETSQYIDYFHTHSSSSIPNDLVRLNGPDLFLTVLNSDWRGYLVGYLKDTLALGYTGYILDVWFEKSAVTPVQWLTQMQFDSKYPVEIARFLDVVKQELAATFIIAYLGDYTDQLSEDIVLDDVDGILVDSFAKKSGSLLVGDAWELQMKRIFDAAAMDKITLLRAPWSSQNMKERMFLTGTYMLLRGNHTYLIPEVSGNTLQRPVYFPELTIDLGAPLESKEELAFYKDGNTGLYVREFEKGIVLVNPDYNVRTFTFTGIMKRAYVTGGGIVDHIDALPGSLSWLNVADSVSLNPLEAVFLMREGADLMDEEEEMEEAEMVPVNDTAGVGEDEDMETTVVLESEEDDDADMTDVIELPEGDDDGEVEDDVVIMEVDTDSADDMNEEDTAFIDVPDTLRNSRAINHLRRTGVIRGYDDGTYRPYQTVNRAELLKILLEGTNVAVSAPAEDCFPDVPKDAWFAPYVCHAKEQGWVEGYPSGFFRPERTVNKVEAVKILGEVQGWELPNAEDVLVFSDVQMGAWYSPYLLFARDKGFLEEEGTVYGPTFGMNRGKIAEYIFRTIVVNERGLEMYDESEAEAMVE